MKYFICPIETMALTQTIFLPDGTAEHIPTDAFAPSMVALAYSKKNYRMRFIGNKDYVYGLINKIETCEEYQYSNKKIICEYIGED